MAIEICKCGAVIDLDYDDQAYTVETEDGEIINLDYAICSNCRDNFQGLLELKTTVDQFTQDVFDWVRCVGDVGMLDHLYEFRTRIEKMTDPHNRDGGRHA